MKITKREIKERIRANGGANQRRVLDEIVTGIRDCAQEGQAERVYTLFWVMGGAGLSGKSWPAGSKDNFKRR